MAHVAAALTLRPGQRRVEFVVARHPGPVVLVSTLVVGGGVALELETQGVGAVIGLALLGALLGAWVVVYDRTMCKAERSPLPAVATGAGTGAAVLPAVASLQLAFGGHVWAGVLIGLVAWGLADSLRWADRRPRRSMYR